VAPVSQAVQYEENASHKWSTLWILGENKAAKTPIKAPTLMTRAREAKNSLRADILPLPLIIFAVVLALLLIYPAPPGIPPPPGVW
jgi:hypothetical protein